MLNEPSTHDKRKEQQEHRGEMEADGMRLQHEKPAV